MDADTLEAGPELDSLVAEHVMGLEVLGTAAVWVDPKHHKVSIVRRGGQLENKAWAQPVYLAHCFCRYMLEGWKVHFGHVASCFEVVPNYSTDIAAAWEIVNKMITRTAYECYLSHQFDGWDCLFTAPVGPVGHAANSPAPLAICRAALKAIDNGSNANGDN